MLNLLLIVLCLLLVSGLSSCVEAALFSIPMMKVRQLEYVGGRPVTALLQIKENMLRPIAAVLIVNNIANIDGSVSVGAMAVELFGSKWMGVISAVMTFLVMVFAEIIPKSLGETFCEKIALLSAVPVLFLSRILMPLIWIIEKMTNFFSHKTKQFTTNEAEILLLAKIGRQEGVINETEQLMVGRVFQLDDQSAVDLMTPRTVMTTLSVDQRLVDVIPAVIKSQHSRIIAIGESRDEIAGVVYKSDLLAGAVSDNGRLKVADFIMPVLFVKENEKADSLLARFQKNHQHLAVVKDEFGGVSGVVTLEDVLEILTGEIMDENDAVPDMQQFARSRER